MIHACHLGFQWRVHPLEYFMPSKHIQLWQAQVRGLHLGYEGFAVDHLYHAWTQWGEDWQYKLLPLETCPLWQKRIPKMFVTKKKMKSRFGIYLVVSLFNRFGIERNDKISKPRTIAWIQGRIPRLGRPHHVRQGLWQEKARQICDKLHFLSQRTSPRITPTWGARGVLCRRDNMKYSLGTRNGNIHS
jgi:hypothetical protein